MTAALLALALTVHSEPVPETRCWSAFQRWLAQPAAPYVAVCVTREFHN